MIDMYEKPIIFRNYGELEEYLKRNAGVGEDYDVECNDDCMNCGIRTECGDSDHRDEAG